ncbi:NnrS family protein [Telluria beijingensis]|uniref:NnrS family protein n=1 Tax=Telluria beijingensis TaxID=3068633 RepID=UPI0027956D50|nr:NnrS family protein [Massilia sp. REN29]
MPAASAADPLPRQLHLASASAPLWRLGFRPFYLLAAAFAATAVPAWLLAYLGLLPQGPVDLLWHTHEMVFGFAVAVVAGFLLTAIQTWTGLATPHGRSLQALVLLWLAGRCAALGAPPLLYALVDVAFLFVVAGVILRLLLCANNRRNLPICGVVALLGVSNLAFHLALNGVLALSPLAPIHGAILLLVLLVAVIGGRVGPMFTRNGAPGSQPRNLPRLDQASIAAIVLTALCWLVAAPGWAIALAGIAAALLNGARLVLWDPLSTLRTPLLWSFHLSYALLVPGLLALGLAGLGAVSGSAALHLLAAGAMSGMIGAMITRTARGHTGRPLKAGGAEIAMFALLPLAVAARLAANLSDGPAGGHALALSAVLWSLAFVVYLLRYGPWLARPRLDGKPG